MPPIKTLVKALSRRPASLTGDAGESIAARHLINQGYFVLKRNHKTRLGELDLVCEAPDKRTIVFVEVKTAEAERDARLAPELRVGQKKQSKITALAAGYLRTQGFTDRPARFDVIGVTLREPPQTPDVRHHPNAFESPW